MDKKLRISIQIGEGRYPLRVDPKDEPHFRLAGRIINDRLNAYRTQFRGIAELTNEDMLAMTALDLVAQSLMQEKQTSTKDAEEQTARMIADLQQFLSQTPEE